MDYRDLVNFWHIPAPPGVRLGDVFNRLLSSEQSQDSESEVDGLIVSSQFAGMLLSGIVSSIDWKSRTKAQYA